MIGDAVSGSNNQVWVKNMAAWVFRQKTWYSWMFSPYQSTTLPTWVSYRLYPIISSHVVQIPHSWCPKTRRVIFWNGPVPAQRTCPQLRGKSAWLRLKISEDGTSKINGWSSCSYKTSHTFGDIWYNQFSNTPKYDILAEIDPINPHHLQQISHQFWYIPYIL